MNEEIFFSRKHDQKEFPKLDEGISIEKLRALAKQLERPIVKLAILDQFVESGGNMENLHMVSSHPEFKDFEEINTQHGIVKVKYTQYVPNDSVYFMNPPTDDYWRKVFKGE